MEDVRYDVEVDDVRLGCHESGHGDPVLLLHPGFVADGMLPLLRDPGLDGFRLVAFHRRGYGGSSRTSGPVSLSRQAADVAELLDRRGGQRAHLVGHSFGANVALQLAVSEPHRLGSLVLLEPLLGFALRPETAA